MGLDTTHDAWHGPYSAFHRWRKAVASAIGINLDNMRGFSDERVPEVEWEALPTDPLHKLLHHSDCDGEIAAVDCGPIADRLEAILDKLPRGDSDFHGHGERDKAVRFIAGLRKAAAAGEAVEFH